MSSLRIGIGVGFGETLPTKAEIRFRIRTLNYALTSTATKIFTNDVQSGVYRYIVYIELHGDATSNRTVALAYGGSGTSARTATLWSGLPLGPNQTVPIPQNGQYDIESPIVMLATGENLLASVNAGTGASLTAIYWDSSPFSTTG